ncbi:MAG: hypothetical protein PQ964_07015 [Methanobacteriaceae archaeon]
MLILVIYDISELQKWDYQKIKTLRTLQGPKIGIGDLKSVERIE